MPAPARHRLDVLFVGEGDPQAWIAEMPAGQFGFHGVRFWMGAERFFSSGQGGFRVYCPKLGGLITAQFVPALGAWRSGGPRALGCTCGETHDLRELTYRPDCAFGTTALVLQDVDGVESEWVPNGARRVLQRA